MANKYEEFKEALKDWTDFDWAAYKAGLYVGLLEPGTKFDKGTYWTANPIGHATSLILDGLVYNEFLLKRFEPDYQYKWNPDYEKNIAD